MSDSLQVRRAGPADFEAACTLLRRFYDEEHVEYHADLLASRMRRFLTLEDAVLLLAFEAARCVGLALVSTSFGVEFGAHAELEDLYVLPDSRGSGVAGRLLEEVRSWCRAHAIGTLSLVVTPEGESAHQLGEYYRRRGFRNSGRTVYFQDIQ